MSDDKAVEQLATVEQHQPDETQSESQKANDKEINFREMRRNFDELNKKVSEKDQVINELKSELTSFKTKVQTAFDVQEPSYDGDEDEPMTKAEFKRNLAEEKRLREIEETPSKFSDYFDVIKFAEPMLKENPALIEAIEKARNPRLAAYQLVKSSYAYRAGMEKNSNAQAVEENLSKPRPSEAISGGSSPDLSARAMTLQEKSEIWRTAQRYARGAGT